MEDQSMSNNGRLNNNIDLHEDLEKIKAALSRTAYDVKDRAGEIWQQSIKDMKEKSTNIEENTVRYVKEHPVKALAISVVAGMIISKLLRK
jgi:ElaB/YqjD/DUF883 family membrane-anchored ribosome-binding protein